MNPRDKPAASGEAASSDLEPSSLGEEDVLQERFAQIYRSRKLFSLMLLPPLAFFVFLVVWFREGLILVAVGCVIYGYMLVQFFIVQNPARRARRAAASHERDGQA